MEETVLKKKPQSLNQRHGRLLVDLSAPRLREEIENSKFKCDGPNNHLDDFPSFAGIADFDSSPDISKLSDHQQSRSSDFVENDVSAHDTNPNFSGVTDFSLVDAFESKKLTTKSNKVKLEGKRRLCKVPAQDDNDVGYKDGNHELQDISDFSSPPRPEEVVSNVDAGGGNEIRDILNDLSSRLEFMSIEKNKNSRPVDQRAVRPVPLHHDSLDEASDIDGYQRNGEMGKFEFTSVDSPFAGSSDQYVSLSRGMQNKELEGDLGRNNFSGVANPNIFACKGKLMTMNKKDIRSQVDSLDGASDRAGYQRNGEMGEFEYTSVHSPFAGSSDQYVSLSCGMQNKELEGDLGRNNFSGVANSSIFAGKGKLMTANKKDNRSDVASRRKCLSRLKDGGGSDKHDCVMLGSGKLPKKDGCDGAAKKDSTNSSVFEVLDDNANDIVSKEEHAITLNDPRSTYKLPPNIGKLMYLHQRDGLRWLWSLHCQGKGGILGDDMGLGKTMQISGYLAGLFNSFLVKRVMIVAPKTLIPHWIKELSVVGLSQKIKEYYGTCLKLREYELEYVLKNNGILLTTYDIVRNNVKQLCQSDFQEDGDEDGPIWDYMFLDEGHLIKNPSTQRAKSLLEVPCAHRIIISGTPIQNNLKELWALFNFCCPDLLGDKKWFKDKYENPVLRGSDKNASERDKRIGSMVAKELRERIQPYFLRRMKSEVFREDSATESAKLSKKNEIIVWLRLTGFQRHLYEAFLKSELVLSAFDGSPLAAITILKKICDHPSLITKRAAEDLLEGLDSELNQEDRGLAEKLAKHAANLTIGEDFAEKHDNVSCKISFILSLLEKLIPEGHSVLIFSQTRKMLNLIQESLLANGFEFLRIDGTTKAADRLKIVNEFQEGNSAPIFLLTSQVGGLGLTLTKADRVIVVDPAWNPSTDSQSVDRAYRIGQKKDVIVYRLMTCGTIEEKIYRMQVFKGGLFKTATEHKEQTRYFTKQDLKELFRLPKDGFDISPTQLQLHEEHGHQILMSDYLKSHIKFLEGLGIGGVSHHSLLFSKSEPTPPDVHIEEDAPRRLATASVRYFGSASTETPVDASQYAFNPKNVDLHKKVPSSEGPYQTESAIRERINRLSQLLSNKVTVSRLPDGGEKIKNQIADLNSKLEGLMKPNRNEVIDLDDISDELVRSLHV